MICGRHPGRRLPERGHLLPVDEEGLGPPQLAQRLLELPPSPRGLARRRGEVVVQPDGLSPSRRSSSTARTPARAEARTRLEHRPDGHWAPRGVHEVQEPRSVPARRSPQEALHRLRVRNREESAERLPGTGSVCRPCKAEGGFVRPLDPAFAIRYEDDDLRRAPGQLEEEPCGLLSAALRHGREGVAERAPPTRRSTASRQHSGIARPDTTTSPPRRSRGSRRARPPPPRGEGSPPAGARFLSSPSRPSRRTRRRAASRPRPARAPPGREPRTRAASPRKDQRAEEETLPKLLLEEDEATLSRRSGRHPPSGEDPRQPEDLRDRLVRAERRQGGEPRRVAPCVAEPALAPPLEEVGGTPRGSGHRPARRPRPPRGRRQRRGSRPRR